jgi:hypothetical protein
LKNQQIKICIEKETLMQSHTPLLLSRWRCDRKYYTCTQAQTHTLDYGAHSETSENRFYYIIFSGDILPLCEREMIIHSTPMTEKDKNEIFYMIIKEFTTKLEVYWHPSFLESARESSYRKFWAWKLPLESRNWRRPRQHKHEVSILSVSIKPLSAFSRHQRKQLYFLWQF